MRVSFGYPGLPDLADQRSSSACCGPRRSASPSPRAHDGSRGVGLRARLPPPRRPSTSRPATDRQGLAPRLAGLPADRARRHRAGRADLLPGAQLPVRGRVQPLRPALPPARPPPGQPAGRHRGHRRGERACGGTLAVVTHRAGRSRAQARSGRRRGDRVRRADQRAGGQQRARGAGTADQAAAGAPPRRCRPHRAAAAGPRGRSRRRAGRGDPRRRASGPGQQLRLRGGADRAAGAEGLTAEVGDRRAYRDGSAAGQQEPALHELSRARRLSSPARRRRDVPDPARCCRPPRRSAT